MNIFNEKLVVNRKNNVARNLKDYNFLRKELALRVSERLDEIKKNFNTCIDFGAYLGEFYEQAYLKIEKIIQLENSKNILDLNPYPNKVLSSYNKLPFTQNSVDSVVAILALGNLNNNQDIINSIFSILKKDGLFILVHPLVNTLADLQHILMETELAMFNSYSQRIHPFLDIKAISNMIFSAGFTDIVATADKIEIMYKNPQNLFKDLKNTANNNALYGQNPRYLGRKFWNAVYQKMDQNKEEQSKCYLSELHYATIIGWKN